MMHSRPRLLLLALLLVAGTLALAWDASAQEPVTSRLKLSIGGYIKPEFIYRTSNGAIIPGAVQFGVNNFGFSPTAQPGTVAHDNGSATFSLSETRIAFTMSAPDWRGIKPTGFIETDFAGTSANVLTAYCPAVNPGTGQGNVCAVGQNAGSPDTGAFGYNAFRMRHAFFRLAGEGLGGSWNMTFGQTWGIFGMLPFYSGSSFSFGGATIFGQRQGQLSFRHDWRLFRDFTWQNAVGAVNDTTRLNESPAGEISTRFIWAGWQGWQGGVRAPINAGFSARVQRQKADVEYLPAGSGTLNTASAAGNKTLSATAWGITGGLFLPILPGRSATDRTWGLSALSEGGYGEGINSMIPGSNPLPAGVLVGSNNRADPGAVYFHPGKCSLFTFSPGVQQANAGVSGTSCGGSQETNLSLIQSRWASWSGQFYLPYGFWISGGQKWIWFTNPENATDSTCITGANGACLNFIVPVNQGRSWLGPNPLAARGAPIVNNASILYGGKDSVIKRLTYNYVSVFYDMTPNIRWGFEWGRNGTNRRDSAQDGNSHRWQFGAYYFF
jgi:hypothetical protein